MTRIVIVLGVLLVVCQPVDAQERVARSLEQLQLLVGNGDTVSVQPKNGVRGRPKIYERRAPAVVSRQPLTGTRRVSATVAFRF